MTSSGFLALAVAGGFGALGIALTIAIASPTNPAPPRPSRRAGARGGTPTCVECRAAGRRCRYHTGWNAGYAARDDHTVESTQSTGSRR